MRSHMSVKETELRDGLFRSVGVVHTAMRRCPALDTLDDVGLGEAALIVAEAHDALREASGFVDSLAELRQLTFEGVMLVSNSRLAFGFIENILGLITAEIDYFRAA